MELAVRWPPEKRFAGVRHKLCAGVDLIAARDFRDDASQLGEHAVGDIHDSL